MSPAAGPSSTTNGSRNLSTNLEHLNAAVSAIEELQVQVRDIKEKADKKMAVLHTENEILKSNVEELSERVSFLATMLGVRNEEDGPGLDGENGGSLSEIDPTLRGTSEPVSEASSSARKLSAMELSFAASKSKAIRVRTKNFLISIHSNFRIKKDVIIDTLKIHLGTDSLAGASLPAFPFGIGEERWPKNPVDQKPYMRLNWDTAYNKWPNAEALDRIFDSLHATGAKRCPAADEDLENICDNDLKERIKDKFVSMAREFKSKRKAQADLQARIQELEDRRAAAEENLDEEFADESTASQDRASKNSRVSSAWGDDEDPIDDAKGKKRKVEANVLSEEKVFKKSRNVKGKQVVLKEKLDNMLGGCDADELFDE
ncbi:hypothetical protein DFH29DRAFT_1024476 [Suillus ampliporus]|nr:hypothetical protein DFH29DRAFT_1024476 [Suillus ampliporus]